MKKSALLTLIGMLFLLSSTLAQNVMSSTDVVTNYPGSSAQQPAAGKIGKWYKTSRMSWSTSQFKCYIYNGMAYRLRFPNGYNPADTVTKYPLIIFFHGGGEIAPITDNEYQLLWGAQDFQDSINAGKFNAFMLFPQVTNIGWDYTYYEKVNTVLDTLKKYNKVDEDRVISMGLSNGGFAALSYSIFFPRRAASVIAASPALIASFTPAMKEYFTHIPLFISSGGLDTNPEPRDVRNFVDSFSAKGGDARYILYPTLGHLTWEQQWSSGYLVNYWNSAHKANPLIFYQQSVFCPDSLAANPVKIGITSGYPEYEWQKDLVGIPGASGNEITVNTVGSYRVRFRRVANGPWSAWSPKPAVISAKPAETTPDIIVTGVKSKVLPALDGSTTVPLELPFGSLTYQWRRVSDNALVSTARTFDAPVGQYKGLIAGCTRTFSNTFTVVNAAGTPKPDAATSVTATRTLTTVNLAWSLARVTLGNPTGFEIYRSATSGGALTLLAVVPAAQRTYSDSDVEDLVPYFYKIRSVNESAAASPSNEVSSNETTAPSTPASFRIANTGRSFVTLAWSASTDNVGVAGYDVYVGGVKKYSTPYTTITLDSLTGNTAYSFTVRARDLSGNLSTASAVLNTTTPTLTSGLRYRFYQGTWAVLPNFNNLTYVKTGTSTTPDLTARTTGVSDNFGFVWEGYIQVPTTGSYTFELSSDDGSKMYLDEFYSPDSVAFIDNDGAHGISPVKTKTVTLTAGTHPVAFTYFEIGGDNVMNVYWTGPGITRRLIPASAYVEIAPVADVTAPTTPGSLISTYADRTSVSLKWNASTDAVGVTGYNVYRNDTLKYTTTGSDLTDIADSLSPNTAYTFKVKARDAAGNLSAFSNAVTVTTKPVYNGLAYKYYQGTSWDSLPNFNNFTAFKTGISPTVDISVRTAGVNDNFGFVWEGYINIKNAGTYTFELESDDGSKFYWNTLYNPAATALVSNDYLHAPSPTVSKTIELAPGKYPVSMTFFEKTLGEVMNVYWTGPGIPRQLIPASAFIETATVTDVVAPSTPANIKVTNTTKTGTTVSWDISTDNVGVAGYDLYVNNVFKKLILGTTVTIDTLTPNTSYAFKVQARDAAGNLSPMSATVSTTTDAVANKFNYKYYQGSFDALPNFDLLTPVKTGNTPNVDISVRPAGVSDNFAFLWEGKITIPTSGTYTFETASDDGSKFYFNTPYSATATATIDNDGLHAETVVTKTLTLTAGVYPVAITFFEKDGGETMKVFWTGPGIARAQIPDAAFADPTSTADVTPPTTPANFKAGYTGRTFIDLTWDNSTDNIGVAGYNVYVGSSTTPVLTTSNKVTISNLTANTNYTFKVQARDADNNLSGFSTVTANSTASGLRYKYYEGDFDALPNFNNLPVVKTGTSANIDVSPRNGLDYYAFVWEGYIKIPTTGVYTFELASDDGSKFYFNSLYDPNAAAMVSYDGLHADNPTVSASRTITAGIYPVAITYFEKTGDENIRLFWTGPGITRQQVPNAAFTESFTATLATVAGPQALSVTNASETAALALEKSLKIKAYPNPFADKLQVQFNNPVSGNRITAVVYDSYGRAIMTKDFGSMAAGTNLLTVNTGADTKPGIYIVRLNINGVPASMWKMVKEKK